MSADPIFKCRRCGQSCRSVIGDDGKIWYFVCDDCDLLYDWDAEQLDAEEGLT